MKKTFILLIIAGLLNNLAFAQEAIKNELEGVDQMYSSSKKFVPSKTTLKFLDSIPPGGLLLIPESSDDRVMAFDPITGDLIDDSFIIENGNDFFATPIQVIQDQAKTKLLVSDQINDVVVEFDNNGNYVGVFAPAGGPNPAYIDNVRGLCLKNGTDHILVSSGNTDAIAEFDGSGNYIGMFGPAGSFDPFDIIYWPLNDQYLVCDISQPGDNDLIQTLDNTGNLLAPFAGGLDFPEQIALAANGNILVATFTSPSGIYEFQPDGTQIGYYDVVTSCRGVYELPNGNLLITSGGNVYEISKNNTIVDTKYSSSSTNFRFVSFIAPPGDVTSITFRVDMTMQIVPPEGVHIAGNFQGWEPGATAMSAIGDNVYTYTKVFVPGDSIIYKYINGDEWGEDETVPTDCALGDNRFIIVPEADTVLDVVCFGSCEPCGPSAQVTFMVDLSEETISPDGIHITGNFQGWNTGSTLMGPSGGDVFSHTQMFEIGETLEYKFINGDEWGEDETVPGECAVNNNRYLVVPDADTILTTVCFGSCYPCGTIMDTVAITFRVDMSEQVISPNGIHLAGNFQGWDPGTTEMELIGNNIFEKEMILEQGIFYEYKFINGNTWDGEETVPEECGSDDGQGGYNRYIIGPAVQDTTLAEVCFSSCEPCSVGFGDLQSFADGTLTVSPNPFNSEINIRLTSTEESNLSLILTDVYGSVVITVDNLSMLPGNNSYTLQMEGYPAGIYFLQAKSLKGEQVVSQAVKILKNK